MTLLLNCDLGEKSIHYDGKNDSDLLKIINSANIACGFHAGDILTIDKTIKEAKKNDVSIGAHPGFRDLANFGRKKIDVTKKELINLIWEQLELINTIAVKNNTKVTHVKPHGALNNLACENIEVALTIGETIQKFNNEMIYVVLPLTEMEVSAKKLNIKYACEIFADRNYEDNGQLISRTKKHALINDPTIASKNILQMLDCNSIICYSGKKIKCNIDTICIHGDGSQAVLIAESLKKNLLQNKVKFLSLNKLKKFL